MFEALSALGKGSRLPFKNNRMKPTPGHPSRPPRLRDLSGGSAAFVRGGDGVLLRHERLEGGDARGGEGRERPFLMATEGAGCGERVGARREAVSAGYGRAPFLTARRGRLERLRGEGCVYVQVPACVSVRCLCVVC